MAITKEQVYEALKDCYDPEVPVNIVELGLVYEVKIIDEWVGVKMTLTTPGCPAHSFISQNVQNRLMKIPGVKKIDIRIVWEPAWEPKMMSEEARKKLKWTA